MMALCRHYDRLRTLAHLLLVRSVTLHLSALVSCCLSVHYCRVELELVRVLDESLVWGALVLLLCRLHRNY